MTGSAEGAERTPGRLAALLIDASAEAISAAGGRVGGVYLRSGTPGLLRLAVLEGLPGPLFRPWWRVHVDRPFPVADAYRLGVEVVLPNATEAMRRYPQYAAGLPFPFGSLYAPVAGRSSIYGVLTALLPSAADATELLPVRERMAQLAEELGTALEKLEDQDPSAVAWEGGPLCDRPPASRPPSGHRGRFAWDPESGLLTADERLNVELGSAAAEAHGTAEGFADAVAPGDAERILAALREAAGGRPPALPLVVRGPDGAPRLVEVWGPYDDSGLPRAATVRGVVLDPGPGTVADAAADLLPDGVLCLDRLGAVVYANPHAARLLRRPRTELLGRPLWEGVPWLNQPTLEDHLR